MTGTEISVIVWGFTTTAGLVASFYKLKSDVRHLEDTKLTKNGIDEKLSAIKTEVALSTEKMNQMDRKVTTLFTKIPCMQPEWGRNKCD